MDILTSLNFKALPLLFVAATILAFFVARIEEVLKKYVFNRITVFQKYTWLLKIVCVILSGGMSLLYKALVDSIAETPLDLISLGIVFLTTCFYSTGIYKILKNSDSWYGKAFQSFSTYIQNYIETHETKTAVISTIVTALSSIILKLLKKYIDEDAAQTVTDAVTAAVETQLESAVASDETANE